VLKRELCAAAVIDADAGLCRQEHRLGKDIEGGTGSIRGRNRTVAGEFAPETSQDVFIEEEAYRSEFFNLVKGGSRRYRVTWIHAQNER